MSKKLGIGILGCGNISAAYMRLGPLFNGIEVRACADLNPEAAKARAEEFGLRADSIDDLLAANDIDIIVNLTVPNAHFEVSKRILEAGKNVYSEKPFVLSVEEGQALKTLAEAKGLRVGSAPDTFLGGTHQLARHLVDTGAVGKITSGTCFVQSPGMEMWHPNPDFFFQPGGGPILDLGPYYISNLVQMLGPVARVTALSCSASEYRTITSEPRNGEKIKVETPTTIHAVMQFASGAQVTYVASWDVWQHGHSNMELYGQSGTLHVPDPNFFGGELRMTEKSSFVTVSENWPHPFSVANDNGRANYRCAGLADMAMGIIEGRAHRCSLEFSLHVVDVMTAILHSGETKTTIELGTTCDRPEALGPDAAKALLA
ncbi:Gfo/Idh/MocA family oxidoreductase [Marinovum sp. 2_MG-2023]|uniref:Gfo/Idh/MocA family protein n=1 Tax=unclassified Marinovum TaxID=2647166 RepID=UPI0026E14D6C|nr:MULTISPECIES: Gfo/Idh/MocA family oxidoreductase [unclassified Marinovum]MDO6729408.1 Gfo/Idh/MocA family oxidoreductase [Marinovum sp. 2_MG-2023]MDO6781356.1 Gfo/Idh/MocA family oxidoreductase [Marinovum sp. 1_MG-2023]